MNIPQELIEAVQAEIDRGIKKWGETDRTPDILLSAATEELGEVAHAHNHSEGFAKMRQEIAECIGILVRLYNMVE